MCSKVTGMSFYVQKNFFTEYAAKTVKVKSNVVMLTHSCKDNVIILLFYEKTIITASFYAKMYVKVALEYHFIFKKLVFYCIMH